ncbi:unnamed protein product [Lampetra fluviatilis]
MAVLRGDGPRRGIANQRSKKNLNSFQLSPTWPSGLRHGALPASASRRATEEFPFGTSQATRPPVGMAADHNATRHPTPQVSARGLFIGTPSPCAVQRARRQRVALKAKFQPSVS